MDIQVLSASQLALVIRLNVFMDNHQTQGIREYESKIMNRNSNSTLGFINDYIN